MKSKKLTSPTFEAGLFGCTPSTRYPHFPSLLSPPCAFPIAPPQTFSPRSVPCCHKRPSSRPYRSDRLVGRNTNGDQQQKESTRCFWCPVCIPKAIVACVLQRTGRWIHGAPCGSVNHHDGYIFLFLFFYFARRTKPRKKADQPPNEQRATGRRGRKKAREDLKSKLLLGQRVTTISLVPAKCMLPFLVRRAGNFLSCPRSSPAGPREAR